MEMIFHSHANKTHFHKRGCALGLISKVRGVGTRSGLLRIIFLWMGLQKSSIIFFPFKAPSFYWEAELCSLGDPEDQDPGPSISVGFAPSTDQLASGWINPVGSCLLHRFFLLCIVFLFFLFGFIVILCFFKGQSP